MYTLFIIIIIANNDGVNSPKYFHLKIRILFIADVYLIYISLVLYYYDDEKNEEVKNFSNSLS